MMTGSARLLQRKQCPGMLLSVRYLAIIIRQKLHLNVKCVESFNNAKRGGDQKQATNNKLRSKKTMALQDTFYNLARFLGVLVRTTTSVKWPNLWRRGEQSMETFSKISPLPFCLHRFISGWSLDNDSPRKFESPPNGYNCCKLISELDWWRSRNGC